MDDGGHAERPAAVPGGEGREHAYLEAVLRAASSSQTQLERFQAIAEVTSDIIGVTLLDGTTAYLNPAGRRFAGLAPDADVSRFDPFTLTSPAVRRYILRVVTPTVLGGEVWEGELDLVAPTTQLQVPMSAVFTPVHAFDGTVEAIAVTYRDLSERKLLERDLHHAARHDALTGLANRHHLHQQLVAELDSGAPRCVLFCDLDDFKVVNDSLGHSVGDELLRAVAERIVLAVGPHHLVGRLGGDEFLVLLRLDAGDRRSPLDVAHVILDAVRQPIVWRGREHVITTSIGVAHPPEGPVAPGDADELVRNADIAMYRAKKDGRRQVVLFDDAMGVEAVARHELERDLRHAIEHDELRLHYQPIVDLRRRRIVDFEALLRWQHPVHGMRAPTSFLGVAEDAGMSDAIAAWVVAEAAQGAARLRVRWPDARVALNVSPRQLHDGDIRRALSEAARLAGVPLQAFAVEITEHALMTDTLAARRILADLRDLGVMIAIDDFGTGYSNLASLRRLPVDFLKIDREFVDGVGVDAADTEIVRLVVSLANQFRLGVIAEGVEREYQATELLTLGCGAAQGFWTGRPMPIESIESLSGPAHRTADRRAAHAVIPPSMLRIEPVMNRASSDAT